MVKLGFIGEGDSEKRFLESEAFRNLLRELNLDFVPEVINAKGGGNLIPDKLPALVATMQEKGATHLFVLTDREDDPCITAVRERVGALPGVEIVVAVRQLESWYLADSETCSQLFRRSFFCEAPEACERPFEFIRREMLSSTGRGIRSKVLLSGKVLRLGFSLERAAAHPNCPSARRFLEKLQSLSKHP